MAEGPTIRRSDHSPESSAAASCRAGALRSVAGPRAHRRLIRRLIMMRRQGRHDARHARADGADTTGGPIADLNLPHSRGLACPSLPAGAGRPPSPPVARPLPNLRPTKQSRRAPKSRLRLRRSNPAAARRCRHRSRPAARRSGAAPRHPHRCRHLLLPPRPRRQKSRRRPCLRSRIDRRSGSSLLIYQWVSSILTNVPIC